MKLVSYREDDAERWDSFCALQDRAWFWHTSWRMRHAQNSSFSIHTQNRSFWIEDAGRVAAIVPLTIDDHRGDGGTVRRMSYGGMRVPAPVVDGAIGSPRARRLLTLIFEEIDRIAAAEGVKVLQMRLALSPAIAAVEPVHNVLTRYGLADTSLSTTIVPLEPSLDDILAGADVNHRRAIRKAEAVLTVDVFDRSTITGRRFDAFQRFYCDAAGKVTRPQVTFDLLRGYLETGLAVLGEARHGDRVVGYAATVVYKQAAYYLMGASDDAFDLCPTAHLIHWRLMNHLRAAGVRFYEMGLQQFGPLPHDAPSVKELNISRFKRGFGGRMVPAFAGEKYYCADHFRETWEDRGRRYGSTITPAAAPGDRQ